MRKEKNFFIEENSIVEIQLLKSRKSDESRKWLLDNKHGNNQMKQDSSMDTKISGWKNWHHVEGLLTPQKRV